MMRIPTISWPRWRSVLAGWVVVLTGLVLAQGMNALALIIVARRIAPLEYGQYLASYSLASLLIVIPAFGMDGWLLATGTTQREQALDLWWSARRVRLGFLALWLPAMAVLALLLSPVTFPPALLILSAVGLAADSLTSLAYAGLRNLNRHRWITGFQAAGSIALLIATLTLPLEPGRVTYFALARTLVSVLLALLVGRWMLGGAHRPAVVLPRRDLLHATRSFMLADAAVSIYLRADLTIVSLFLGPAGASVYGPALNLANMCFLVPSALYFLVVPSLARAYRRSRQAFMRVGAIQLAAQTATGVMLSIAIFVLAGPIVRLVYGPGYESSIAVLRLLSPLLAAKSINFGLGALLTTAGLQARRTAVQVFVAAFNVSANLLAVRTWGTTGVALIYVASEVLLCIGYALVFTAWRRAFRPTAAPAAG
jgi:O-antigen/teichoic acid export membrane protein